MTSFQRLSKKYIVSSDNMDGSEPCVTLGDGLKQSGYVDRLRDVSRSCVQDSSNFDILFIIDSFEDSFEIIC